jgi:hypothetical protein
MKLLPLRWKEGRKRGRAAASSDVSKVFSFALPYRVRYGMTQYKVIRTGHLKDTKRKELNWNFDGTRGNE